MNLLAIVKRVIVSLVAFVTAPIYGILARRLPNIVLTCVRDDGGGAQIHGRLSVAAFCKFYGFNFSNSPMTSVHFGDSREWLTKWNTIVSFPLGTLETSQMAEEKVHDAHRLLLSLILQFVKDRNGRKIFVIDQLHAHTNNRKKILEDFLTEFRSYHSSPKEAGANGFAIHLRRGDDETASVRFEGNEQLLKTISSLRAAFGNETVTVYSNAEDAELSEKLASINCVLDTESDVFTALNHMAKARVFIGAKSSLSYVAACLNPGQVFFPEFWHPILSGWQSKKILSD